VRLYGHMHPVSAALTRVVNKRVFVHPGHSSVTLRNDIAVFHLPMESTTAPVTVNRRAMNWEALGPTDRLNVVGIGRTETGTLSMEYNSAGKIDPLSLGVPREASLSRRSCFNPVGYGQLKGWTPDAHLTPEARCFGKSLPRRGFNSSHYHVKIIQKASFLKIGSIVYKKYMKYNQ